MSSVNAAIVEQIGSYGSWPTTWTAIGGYDTDATDQEAAAYLDFVGDASDPGLYYASDESYVYFRMRVDEGTFTSDTASGAHILLIDIVGVGNDGIDYGFSWDSKSNDPSSHGLEMSVVSTNGPSWGVSQVDDLDGSNAKKETNDINGDGRTTDGYVRTVDGVSTTSFGTTSFIDFAVSWSYLDTYTDLDPSQTWNVTAASIANATDHNAFNADVMGAELTDSVTTGWTSVSLVPEPGNALAIVLVVALGTQRWRRRR
nr:hypothetical protein [Verrucomicrobiota bacterium JB025]